MKKKIKKILLAGLGAEIGSMLLSMNDPKNDGLLISEKTCKALISQPFMVVGNYGLLKYLRDIYTCATKCL